MSSSKSTKPDAKPSQRGRGADVFTALRNMAISYQMKPGERLNELELAAQFGVSRTPVREALTRLASEGLLMESTRGYVRKPLDIQEMADLYEARMAIERECLRLAFERASEQQLQDISEFLTASMATPATASSEKLVELDEGFHLRIADMARNAELKRMLISLNERLRFIRWIDMENVGRESTQQEHSQIVDALIKRDQESAQAVLTQHIGSRRERIVASITQGLARIYL
ncbi:GntR family transcriptional regulator [Candidimonas sp. SYP-B2681]|uniref:GntR family transcriptional regulator n=1 Tax=Candidimonas sp. SYP-B2681 TaxID=2497686 RepID=UPI000F85DCCC|nr:GntR family transcriptional regulator [Candidimonas sp. SYP-B2681]RTZ43372.1 GntR family transcriptional regulator [Candidimonas sp. SYP-B2681]